MRLFDKLFRYEAIDLIFSDREYIQSLLHFEGALSRAEAKVGVIPTEDAQIITAACRAEQFNIEELAAQAALSGNVAIPLIKKLTGLVAKESKDAARFVHWGATSQDAMDTGVVLQLRRALEVVDQDLARLTSMLAALADKYRATPVAAHTWMQQALPTTFGFIVAGWLDAILRHRSRLSDLRARNLTLQFGGAVGTLAALSGRGPAVAKALAEELHLPLPSIPWHTHRDRIAEIAAALGLCVGTLGKIARDISLHAQTEIAELAEPAGEGRGGSSTMPQKRNPVTCAAVLAAAQRVPGLVATMLSSMVQEQERGLGGWQAEWETLPEIVCLSGGALHHLTEMLPGLHVDEQRMLKNLDATHGLIFAEAVTMALGDRLGKMPAHALVESACKKARAENRPLKDVLREEHGLHGYLTHADLEGLFDVRNYIGSAEEFVRRVLAELSNTATAR
ncbi:MAG TPA: 3-carboxy-cis,cis-muconate cycloisomerase [Candidatus Acidoferrales bacterium]|jgi:3-carboxy-cis,cis-muconate cycloisomerase|nr:3-carboxy-cis,cis-muconate cycloisomerase [Candidatus Acidoferrales bacterium]